MQINEDLDKVCADYIDNIYHGVSGFISYQPGEKENNEKNNVFLTYGEIVYSSVSKIIDELSITEDDVFYDMGSGIGKVPLHFFMKTRVKKAGGIEASLARHNMAENALKKIQSDFKDLFANGRSLEFHQGNFLEVNIIDATIIYTCSTCFSEGLLADIATVMNHCPKLKAVISMKQLPGLQLPFDKILDIECTWDKTKCYIYKRV